jgi:hypothetical protein
MSTTLVVITSKKNNAAIRETPDGTIVTFNGKAKIDLHERDEKDDEIIENITKSENLNYLQSVFPSILELEPVVIKLDHPDDNANATEKETLIMTDSYNNCYLTFRKPVISKKNFFEKNYKPGGMCSLKEMKRHPEWKDEYAKRIEVRKMHMCKSCKRKWMKGCCKNYSQENRVMIKMVIGWNTDLEHENFELEFIEKHVFFCKDLSISIFDMYDAFKDWFKSTYPAKKIPGTYSFSKELRNANIDSKNGILQDVALKF